jgi:hypothetical protein
VGRAESFALRVCEWGGCAVVLCGAIVLCGAVGDDVVMLCGVMVVLCKSETAVGLGSGLGWSASRRCGDMMGLVGGVEKGMVVL